MPRIETFYILNFIASSAVFNYLFITFLEIIVFLLVVNHMGFEIGINPSI